MQPHKKHVQLFFLPPRAIFMLLLEWDECTKDQNQGLVRDVRALLRNCIFGITPGRDGM